MAPTLPKGIKIAFSNTPQAKDDQFGFAESIGGVVQYLDVMGNDLAGNAKSLYSLDDSINSGGINGDVDAQKSTRLPGANMLFCCTAIWGEGHVGASFGAWIDGRAVLPLRQRHAARTD